MNLSPPHFRAFSNVLLTALFALALAWGRAPAHDEPSEQIDDLAAAVHHAPRDAALRLRRAELLRQVGRYRECAEDLARAERLAPGDPAVDFTRGLLYLDTGEPARARAALDRLLSRAPDHGEALVLRARASLAIGERAQATRDYDHALATLHRVTADHYSERAGLETTAPESALRILDLGIARFGPISSLEDQAIALEVGLGRHDAALARLDLLAPQFDRKAPVLVRRAELLAQAGRLAEARVASLEALASLDSLPPRQRESGAMADLVSRAQALLARELESPLPTESPR
jgi:predicted Zn-dependent protease